MRLSILFLMLGCLLPTRSSSQHSFELTANYSLYYNYTAGVQLKWIKPIVVKDNLQLEAGVNPSIHYAKLADTDEGFERFSGNHWHYHLSAFFGPQVRLFKKRKWSLAFHGMMTYAIQTNQSEVTHDQYDIQRSYDNTYQVLAGGLQTSIGFAISPKTDLVFQYTSIFTDLPDFLGLGLRKNW